MEEDNHDQENQDIDSLFFTPHSHSNVFSRLWLSSKEALMGTLFVMAKDMSLGFKLNLLALTIDFLQTLSFPFNLESEFAWNTDYSYWFAEIVIGTKLEFYISHEREGQNIAIYAVSVSFVFLTLVNAAVIGYRFFDNRVQNVFLLKVLRSTASLLASILYLPLLSQFSIVLSCSLDLMQHSGCPSSLKPLFSISSSLISLVFALLALIVVASFYEQDSNSEDAAARPHARIELIFLLIKSVFTVEFFLMYPPEFRIYHIVSLLLLNGLTAFLYCYFLPFYDFTTTAVQAGFACILFWAAVCLTVASIEDREEDAGPISMFYIGSPVAWVFGKYICEWRRRRLACTDPSTVTNVYEVELATRFLIIDKLGSLQLKRIHQLPQYAKVMEEIEEFYYESERRFPNSSILQLFAAQFYLTFRESPTECMVKIEKARSRHPALDEQFIIYKRQQSVSGQSHDAIAFVTFNTHLTAAHKAEVTAIRAQELFWTELCTSRAANFPRLSNLAKAISHNIDVAAKHYAKLMSMNANKAKLLKMYAYFLQYVRNEPNSLIGFLNRAQNLEMSRDREKDGEVSVKTKDGVAILRLSAENHCFGLVEKANNRTLSLLLRVKSSVINVNFSTFLSPIFQHFTMARLRTTVRMATEEERWRPFEVFLLDKERFLVYGTCRVRLVKPDWRETNEDFESQMGSNVPDEEDISPGLTAVKATFLDPSPRMGVILSPRADSSISSRRSSIVDSLCKLVLEITVEDPEPLIAVVESSGKLVHVTRNAGGMLGVKVDEETGYKIRDFVFMFDEYLKKAMDGEGGKDDSTFTSSPTFMISSTGKIKRVILHFRHYFIEKTLIWVVRIQLLSDFNEQTLRFFSIFTFFMSKSFATDPQKASETAKTDLLMHHFKRIRLQIDSCNKEFSPELKKLQRIVLVFVLILALVYIGSYVATQFTFEEFYRDLEAVSIANRLKQESLAITTLVLMLDLKRQGGNLAITTPDLLSTLNSSVFSLKDNLQSFRDYFPSEFMAEQTVSIIEMVENGVRYEEFTTVDAILRLGAYADGMLNDEGLKPFDVERTAEAYWIYQNGGKGIAKALRETTDNAAETAKAAKETIVSFILLFLLFEFIPLMVSFLLLFPYLLKAETIQFEVIRVFYSLPLSVVKYLLAFSKNVLRVMERDTYPDSHAESIEVFEAEKLSKLPSQSSTTGKLSQFSDSRTEFLLSHLGLKSKILAILRVPIVVKYGLFVAAVATYATLLQVYVGVMLEAYQTNPAADVIKFSGMAEELFHQATLSLLSMLIAKDGANTDGFSQVKLAHMELHRNSQELLRYMTLFRVGDPGLGIPSDYMYQTQIDQFYPDFFDSACYSQSDCPQFYSGLLDQGLYSAVHGLVFDLEYVGNK